jgi:hypothetical protein
MRKLLFATLTVLMASCERQPPLHLYDSVEVDFNLPMIDLQLDVYWKYDWELTYDVKYDWRSEWYYGWDDNDRAVFGEMGYVEPNEFNLRRYYTGDVPYGPRLNVRKDKVYGKTFSGRYEWGYWDLLVWNEISTIDGVQSLRIDEDANYDSVVASTGPSMMMSRYQAPRYTRSFYEPELLFGAQCQAEAITSDLKGFIFDAERNVYFKQLNMVLQPLTYIYLTQVILHNNNGRVKSVDGSANLSGMARSVVINTGRAGNDPVTVYYKVLKKDNCDMKGERVDIIGGRLVTFGMCNQIHSQIRDISQVTDKEPHYMDVTMQFDNGMDSTLVFDVTDQVRRRYRGGVITVELNMDTVPIPSRSGGSGFDAVVKDFEDGGTHEFEM